MPPLICMPPMWEPPPPKPRPCPKADALVDESAKLPSDAMAARARMVDLRDMWFSWCWCGRGPLFIHPLVDASADSVHGGDQRLVVNARSPSRSRRDITPPRGPFRVAATLRPTIDFPT